MVYSFPKNSSEEVRAEFTDWKGRRYINLRAYFRADDGQWLPTKKGLTLSVDCLPELAKAVAALQAAAPTDDDDPLAGL